MKNLIEGAGGTLEAFYFGFGETDAYTIADLPDDATAVAFSLAAAATGMMVLKTTVLVTPETVDQAIATKVSFRTPGTLPTVRATRARGHSRYRTLRRDPPGAAWLGSERTGARKAS